tara:strand:+ start:1040 stop:2248 length:1209 start_codon:yes stop_codon:yes gene_type:complete
MNNIKVLYCTYDGLLDPLGQSQILPYMYKFKKFVSELHIISFEKKKLYNNRKNLLKNLKKKKISWNCFKFNKRYFFLGKILDSFKIFFYIIYFIIFKKINIIHSRGYFPLIFIIFFKKYLNIKIIFDMRGFWIDEKKDCGALNMNNFIHRIIYNILKYVEKKLIINSDKIIVLTKRSKLELINKFYKKNKYIFVIPCCADFDFFKRLTNSEKKEQRKKLNINPRNHVICYLGSLGTWYMLEEMINFFDYLSLTKQNLNFLIITNDIDEKLKKLTIKKNKNNINKIIIINTKRKELPKLLGCADVTISFIKPYFSKIASSPTKYAESLAMGIPVISNNGVGDIDEITKKLNAGQLIDPYNFKTFSKKSFEKIINLGGDNLRLKSKKMLSLDFAISEYKKVYNL